MRVSRGFCAEFDDDNLIATAGLVPVMVLAESAGLSDLVDEHVMVAGGAGVNARVKVAVLVAGMVAGADSMSDRDLIRHGGADRAFTEHRAAPTLGTHPGGSTLGHHAVKRVVAPCNVGTCRCDSAPRQDRRRELIATGGGSRRSTRRRR